MTGQIVEHPKHTVVSLFSGPPFHGEAPNPIPQISKKTTKPIYCTSSLSICFDSFSYSVSTVSAGGSLSGTAALGPGWAEPRPTLGPGSAQSPDEQFCIDGSFACLFRLCLRNHFHRGATFWQIMLNLCRQRFLVVRLAGQLENIFLEFWIKFAKNGSCQKKIKYFTKHYETAYRERLRKQICYSSTWPSLGPRSVHALVPARPFSMAGQIVEDSKHTDVSWFSRPLFPGEAPNSKPQISKNSQNRFSL